MNKSEFRKKMLTRSESLSVGQRAVSDEKIYESFINCKEYADAKNVFAYVGIGSEISTDKLIDKMLRDGKSVSVPLCHGKGEMDAVRIESRSELHEGRYGIPEPSDAAEKTPAQELDLIIVPGVAFGEDGVRLGRGGGYYDRFLKKAKNAYKIALCREINIEKTVPHEEHDESVDIIVSDARVIKNKVR